MKTLSLTTTDEIFNQAIDALCFRGSYQDGDKIEFAKSQLLILIGDCMKDYARQKIRNEAELTIRSTVKSVEEQITNSASLVEIEVQ